MSGKIIYKNLNADDKHLYFGDLIKIVRLTTDSKDYHSFISDVLTLSELIMLARRIQIAKLLMTNHSYTDIKKALKTSNSTIALVDTWLSHGLGIHKDMLIDHFSKKSKKNTKNINYIKTNLKKYHHAQYVIIKLLETGKQ